MTGPADPHPESTPFERATALRLGVASFAILSLELAIIRWMGGQIRLFAYFNNLILIAAFLGMGLGVALGRRRPDLVVACLPALAALSAVLAFSGKLGLMHLHFPDISIHLWGAEQRASLLGFLGATAVVIGLFWMVAAVFLFAGIPVGSSFASLPPLKAYSADILGSLLGVAAMTALAALGTSPPVWLAVPVLCFLWLSPRPVSAAAAAAVVGLAFLSVGGAEFSPYNRIDLTPAVTAHRDSRTFGPADWDVSVNRDFHQQIIDLSPAAVLAGGKDSAKARLRDDYELPFRLRGPAARALVVGAGTGNDVAAALRCGFGEVVSIDIDRNILSIGARLHPERPYSDSRVRRVVNDARAYFEQNPGEKFDVVCYGLLDSHAMFSAMTSLRLDNYVYTVEGVRSGWAHVRPGGVLSVSFSAFAGRWIVDRMVEIIRRATGQDPLVIPLSNNFGVAYLVGRPLDLRRLPAAYRAAFFSGSENRSVRVPTDDWPFLYLRPSVFPYAYVVALGLILATASLAIRRVYGPLRSPGAEFDVPLFLMGAAFMLLEARMVTALSLLFGSTWVVNASVFFSILVMVLAANLSVARRAPKDVRVWFLPLALSLFLVWGIGPGSLNHLPVLWRGIAGGLLFAVPVAFAGVIFSTLLGKASEASAALGSNLLGTVFGGCLEYLSMAAGLRDLALLALALYLGALIFVLRSGRLADAPVGRSFRG